MVSDFSPFQIFKLLTETFCVFEILYNVSPLFTVYVFDAAELSIEVPRNKISAKLKTANSFFNLLSPLLFVSTTKIAREYYRHVTIKGMFHYKTASLYDISIE